MQFICCIVGKHGVSTDPEQDKPYHVVCDASNFVIGCALMQFDTDGAARII